MKLKIQNVVLVLLSILFFNSCSDTNDAVVVSKTSTYSSNVALSWIDLTAKLTKETPGFSPPVVARVYGYSGLALYESVRQGMPGYKSLEGQITEFNSGTIPLVSANVEYHWGAVANAALSTFLHNCFQTSSAANIASIDALEQQYVNQFTNETSSEVMARSIAYGKAVGNAILIYANTDGQSECYKTNFPTNYVVPTGAGFWEPTSTANPIPLQPYWGTVRPFMQINVANVLPVAPPTYSTDPNSDFYKEALEVYQTVNNLTSEQLLIAKYWSDDPGYSATPPGHSFSIMKQTISEQGIDLASTAVLYAKLGMGLHDAFVSCWYAKYHYNLIRPISYIHHTIDGTWTTPLDTPAFPEYTSGHSVQSGAAARILTEAFGDNYSFIDKTNSNRTDIEGTPRVFSSFNAAATEAAISRLYGGIHYRSAIELGLKQGTAIGANIETLKFK